MSGTDGHRYEVHCSWSGSTGLGYEAYDRTHRAQTVPATVALTLSADPAFRGDPAHLDPEQLLVLAAASCQLLSFLAVAARSRLEVVAYADDAVGHMPAAGSAMAVTRIELHPRITFASPVDEARVHHLVEVAHRECYIANSLRSEIVITPTIAVATTA